MNIFYLKIIALITMIIDHTGFVFFPNIILFRLIGRLAFPIYAFLITEGIKNTKNINIYIKRLFIFAIISEIFFDLCFYGNINFLQNTNTIYTLLIGVVSIYLYNTNNIHILKYLYLFLGIFLSYLLNTDYSTWGILLIYIFYFFGNKIYYGILWSTGINFSSIYIIFNSIISKNINMLSSEYIIKNILMYLCMIIPFIFLHFYNYEKGKSIKWLFYIAYPLHLAILYLIKLSL